MSVIVKGMEMPKYCYDCPLQDGEDGRCKILGITVYDIPKECPLVELVRCKDCVHHINAPKTTDVWCERIDGLLQRNWFCADGERGDNE